MREAKRLFEYNDVLSSRFQHVKMIQFKLNNFDSKIRNTRNLIKNKYIIEKYDHFLLLLKIAYKKYGLTKLIICSVNRNVSICFIK